MKFTYDKNRENFQKKEDSIYCSPEIRYKSLCSCLFVAQRDGRCARREKKQPIRIRHQQQERPKDTKVSVSEHVE